jgi:hypothetical protein
LEGDLANVALGPDGGEHLERGPRHHRVLVEHGFRNVGDSELRVVNVNAPNIGFGRRMRED